MPISVQRAPPLGVHRNTRWPREPACRRASGARSQYSVPREPFFAGLNFLRGKNLRRLGSDDDHYQHWTRWGFLRFARNRLRIIAAPQDTFPWTVVLGEL